ncbi:MAG: response regulator [Rhodospirillales bacterium]
MAVDVGMKVLIVDDYPTMLKVLRSLLRQLKFTDISEASNAKDALAMLREGGYGLVISDWNMEPMSGFELLQAVRADAALKDLPFILVTAESTTDRVIAAKQAGVSNYIIKPYTAATLKTKLVSVLGEF